MHLAYSCLFLSSATAAVGQIMLKLGANRGGLAILKAPQFWVGSFSYFLSFLLWVYALSKVDLSIAYPFTALTFIMVFLLGFFVLGEAPNKMQFLGLLAILFGFLLMFINGAGRS